MTITEMSNLVDIRYRAFRKLEQSCLVVACKFESANLEECEYLITDPVEDAYLQVVYKDGEFVVCSDVLRVITLTYHRLLAITYFVDYLNTLLHLNFEGEDKGGQNGDSNNT